uniref:Uncharacterized protein n=1 Tax=Oryzias latipes TaxID=8090 RepID=A0A3P9MJA6_ORYLA
MPLWRSSIHQPQCRLGTALKGLVRNGHMKRVLDDELRSHVMEIDRANAWWVLSIPYLLQDLCCVAERRNYDQNVHRWIRASTGACQSKTKVITFIYTMPLKLDDVQMQCECNLFSDQMNAHIKKLRVQIPTGTFLCGVHTEFAFFIG